MIRDLRSAKDQPLLRAAFRFAAMLTVRCLFALLVFGSGSQAQVSAAISGTSYRPSWSSGFRRDGRSEQSGNGSGAYHSY